MEEVGVLLGTYISITLPLERILSVCFSPRENLKSLPSLRDKTDRCKPQSSKLTSISTCVWHVPFVQTSKNYILLLSPLIVRFYDNISTCLTCFPVIENDRGLTGWRPSFELSITLLLWKQISLR